MEKPSKEAAKNKISPLSPSQSSVISLSSSCSSNRDSFYSEDSDMDGWDIEGNIRKKQMIETVLPVGFLDPLTPEERSSIQKEIARSSTIGNNNDYFLGWSNAPIVVKQESSKNLGNASKDKAVLLRFAVVSSSGKQAITRARRRMIRVQEWVINGCLFPSIFFFFSFLLVLICILTCVYFLFLVFRNLNFEDFANQNLMHELKF